MQTASQSYLDAVEGSAQPVAVVDAWYEGDLVAADLPIIGGSVTLDAARAITGSATVVTGSPDATLVPSRWDAPLAPYGSELQIRCGLKAAAGTTELFSLGWYRIDKSKPEEWWDTYPHPRDPSAPPLWACKGVKVTAECSDHMSYVDGDKFVIPEAPASLTSVLDEIRRIARDSVPIASFTGLSDAAIPASVSYQSSRVQAIQDLADVIGRVARVDPDGALALHPKTPSGPAVWSVDVGRGRGKIMNWDRPLDRSGLYNAVISTGTTPDGVPVQGVAVEPTGPLRYNGPFGRVPYPRSSSLITSEAAAQADAQTWLARLVRERIAPVVVSCAPNFALLLDDIVEVVLPDTTLSGPVSAITWPLPKGPMQMTVMVPIDQLWG